MLAGPDRFYWHNASDRICSFQFPVRSYDQNNSHDKLFEFHYEYQTMFHSKLAILAALSFVVVAFSSIPDSACAQRRFQIGGPNGVAVGGGRGLTIGGGYGVQLGGGQGLRFGPPGAGVQYGGGQGIRYGTRNYGVQYGGGQLLRYGGPNAGVKVGGGEGVRLGTTQAGIQVGNGNGLQAGRFAVPTQPAYPNYRQPVYQQPRNGFPTNNYSTTPVYQPPQYRQPATNGLAAPVYQPNQIQGQTNRSVLSSANPTIAPQATRRQAISQSPSIANPVAGQSQFDAARQPAVAKPKTVVAPKNDASSKGKSILDKR